MRSRTKELPDEPGPARRRPPILWKLGLAFVAGAAVAGVAVGLTVGGGSGKAPTASSEGIDMRTAVSVDCGTPVAPGPEHPDALLAQIFNVHTTRGAYTLGWQIIPFHGASRTYRFATAGNILALEPLTGGKPVGYGKGSITFGPTTESGTISAVITLKHAGTLDVGGPWRCSAPVASSTPTTAAPSGIS
jgi:hypothetical protein